MKNYRLHFSAEGKGLIFLLAEKDDAAFSCTAAFQLETAFGKIAQASSLKKGVYRVWLTPDKMGAREIVLTCDGVVPFLMPGPGITPSHFQKPMPSVKLAGNTAYALTVPMGEGQENLYLAYQLSGAPVAICLTDGTEELSPHWYPECAMPYQCARLALRTGVLTAQLRTSAPTRLTVWEGNPMFLDRAEGALPMGGLRLIAVDEDGQEMDARFEVYVGDELVLQRDVLTGEDCVAWLPEGAYSVFIHHGGRFSRASRFVLVRGGEVLEVSAALRELLPLPKGWVWGDEHIHSVFEDGSPLPDMILRAARATGSNYAFLTDHQVTDLIEFGVDHADKPGQFIGMAGQEITCHELHMNILNAPWAAEPGLLPYNKADVNILSTIRHWLDQIEEMKKTQPVTFMLNHPYHDDATRLNPALGYFRSWWVHDCFPEFAIVENHDFQSWFDRLNRGEHLTGVWTTDSHDCSRLYAGKKGTCLYVGDELTPASIIDALNRGRSFSARWPGATLFLTVNGVMMGDELRVKKGEHITAKIEAAATLPIREVEVVVNDFVTAVIPAHGAMELTAEIELPEDALWAVARLRLEGGEWTKDDHCFEPLMVSGFAAFTNPVYIREED